MSESISTISVNYSTIGTTLVDEETNISEAEVSTISLSYSTITTPFVSEVSDMSGVNLSTISTNASSINIFPVYEITDISGASISTITMASLYPSFSTLAGTGTVPSPFVISLSELTSSIQVQLQKENMDKQLLDNFVHLNPTTIRPSMFEWAAKGFPDYHPVHSVHISLPTQCSDGKTYDTLDYLNFLLKSTITDCAAIAQSKMEEIDVSYQYNSGGITWVVKKHE